MANEVPQLNPNLPKSVTESMPDPINTADLKRVEKEVFGAPVIKRMFGETHQVFDLLNVGDEVIGNEKVVTIQPTENTSHVIQRHEIVIGGKKHHTKEIYYDAKTGLTTCVRIYDRDGIQQKECFVFYKNPENPKKSEVEKYQIHEGWVGLLPARETILDRAGDILSSTVRIREDDPKDKSSFRITTRTFTGGTEEKPDMLIVNTVNYVHDRPDSGFRVETNFLEHTRREHTTRYVYTKQGWSNETTQTLEYNRAQNGEVINLINSGYLRDDKGRMRETFSQPFAPQLKEGKAILVPGTKYRQVWHFDRFLDRITHSETFIDDKLVSTARFNYSSPFDTLVPGPANIEIESTDAFPITAGNH